MKLIITKLVRRRIVDEIMWNINRDQKILELGCGTGWLVDKLRSERYDVTGADLHYEADLRFDARDTFPIPNNKFDVIIAIAFLEHVYPIEEIKRILKPGGLLIATIANPRYDRICDILAWFKLVHDKVTDHIFDITSLEEIPMKMISKRSLLFRSGYVGVLKNEVGSCEKK